MPRDRMLTEPRNISKPRLMHWIGLVSSPRRKDWNSFLMAWMEKSRIQTAMATILAHLVTRSTKCHGGRRLNGLLPFFINLIVLIFPLILLSQL